MTLLPMWLYDDASPFPGLRALAPTLGEKKKRSLLFSSVCQRNCAAHLQPKCASQRSALSVAGAVSGPVLLLPVFVSLASVGVFALVSGGADGRIAKRRSFGSSSQSRLSLLHVDRNAGSREQSEQPRHFFLAVCSSDCGAARAVFGRIPVWRSRRRRRRASGRRSGKVRCVRKKKKKNFPVKSRGFTFFFEGGGGGSSFPTTASLMQIPLFPYEKEIMTAKTRWTKDLCFYSYFILPFASLRECHVNGRTRGNCLVFSVCVPNFFQLHQVGGGKKKPNVLLWGDSHAFHYVGLLEEFAIARQSSFVHSCMAACPPMINVRKEIVLSISLKIRNQKVQKLYHVNPLCNGFNDFMFKEMKDYEWIILGGRCVRLVLFVLFF